MIILQIIEIELILSDLEIVQNRINKMGKKIEMAKDKKEIKRL